MDVYFLRHGLAGQHGDPQYKDDSLRPLTQQGREKMRRGAHGMQALGLKFDTILSSPYLRAKQTARIVAQAYAIKNKNIHLTDNLLPPATIKNLLKEIHAGFPASKNILLVGHEPHLSGLISSLLKCRKPLAIDFKKGALCCLSLTQEQAIFNWLMTSAQLGLIGKR